MLATVSELEETTVEREMTRLQQSWQTSTATPQLLDQLIEPEALAEIDLFDQLQLESVLTICTTCKSLSEAGRRLYGASRLKKASSNDSDRLNRE